MLGHFSIKFLTYQEKNEEITVNGVGQDADLIET
jgi:hypothetical protein